MMKCSLTIVTAVVACAHPVVAPGPSPETRAEITSAEDAELHRHHDVARARYEQAIASARDPASESFARRQYAETLADLWGEVDAAQSQLAIAVAIAPDDAAAWHDLGLVRHRRGDSPGAIDALEHAKQLAPRDIRPRQALAALRWHLRDFDGATAEYKALLALDLPERLRAKIRWALEQLARPDHGLNPS
jgi:Flp pilus assembly protein TadD